MQKILRDENCQNELSQKGYSTLPLLSDRELIYLLDELKNLKPDTNFAPNGGITGVTYHSTTFDTDSEYKQKVSKLIREVFTRHVERIFVNYKIVVCNIFVKPSGMGKVEVHQHFPLTTDFQEKSFVIWCPLVDVDESNGTLQVIEGSHKIVPNIAAIGSEYFYSDYVDALTQKYSTPISLKAGECVIFDNNLLHWSENNQSSFPRYAIQVLCVPAKVQPVFYYLDRNKPDQLEMLEMSDENFFIENAIVDLVINRPKKANSIGFVDNNFRTISEHEFENLLRNGEEIAPTIRVHNKAETLTEKPSLFARIKAMLKKV